MMARGTNTTFQGVLHAEDEILDLAGTPPALDHVALHEALRKWAGATATIALPLSAGLPQRVGLALSGGGIRSATFCLGVLQGLATKAKLTGLDYISSVSGGGYIAAWLTAWMHRAPLRSGVCYVQKQLRESVAQDLPARRSVPRRSFVFRGPPSAASAPTQPSPTIAPAVTPGALKRVEPAEISWLRRYSNYLAPQVGMLSADSLTLLTTWLRNTMLNLVIIVSMFATALTAVHLPLYVSKPAWQGATFACAVIAVVAACVAFAFVAFNLRFLEKRPGYGGKLARPAAVRVVVCGLGAVAALCGALWFFGGPIRPVLALVACAAALVVVGLVWIILKAWPPFSADAWRRVPWTVLGQYVLGAIAGLATNWLLFWGAQHLWSDLPLAKALTWGPAIFLVAFGISGSVFIGISGRAYFERSREWWSRMNALLITTGLAWLASFWLALYARPFVDWVIASMPGVASVLGGGWVAALLGALKGRAPAKSTARTKQYVELGLGILSGVALVGFFIAVAIATDYVVLHAAGFSVVGLPATDLSAHIKARDSLYAQWPGSDLAWQVAALLAGLLVTCLLFAWRVDINKFSLHNMYKNRLVRCYLGASNTDRKPQPFTGFDEKDDIELVDIRARQRPMLIVNTALNLAQGRNLAWQQRKAASFVFTRVFCGFQLSATQGDTTEGFVSDDPENAPPAGYRPTAEYADPGQVSDEVEDRKLSLGSAFATSGAAVSPNMGAGTSTVRAFLLTVFNARIGRWCPNPAYSEVQQLSPTFGFRWLMQELFGGTSERSKYVYLSDGGHFENLGLYELVRRRCSLVIVVDAAADPERTFADLGRAIRQCRVDLGVEIRLPLESLRREGNLAPEEAYAWGEIVYDGKTTPKQVGTLLYIKPTLTRAANEPADVQAYARRDPTFPQQPTSDQFFDESQFESYRRLGLHITQRVLADPRSQLIPCRRRRVGRAKTPSAGRLAPTG